MTMPQRDPHFFDCPSCKAFGTLRLFGHKRHDRLPEYECAECHEQFDENALEREAAKRKPEA